MLKAKTFAAHFNESKAKFSFKTFTPGSPRKPRSAGSVFARISASTFSTSRLRALATRGAWSSAFARLMCGSRPLAEAVTASAGTRGVGRQAVLGAVIGDVLGDGVAQLLRGRAEVAAAGTGGVVAVARRRGARVEVFVGGELLAEQPRAAHRAVVHRR